MNDSVFNGLNKAQKEAVLYADGPSIILAGAGSGKTKVLIQKVMHLIHNHTVLPSSIMMVTFTNKAAAEMKKRVNKSLGFIGTFHSLGVRILRRYGEQIGLSHDFVIYDSQDQEDIIKEVIKKLQIQEKYTPSYFLNKISGAKDQFLTPEQYGALFHDYMSSIIYRVYDNYQKALQKNNAVDFDDLIFKTALLFKEHPETLDNYQDLFPYILVDEFQDTNFTQYLLVRQLGGKHKNVTAVGDFSQSIYSWRGAEIKNLQKFEEDFEGSRVFYLEQNYRSTQKILDFAYEVISKNQTHPVLKLFTHNESGEDVIIKEVDNEQEEALSVAEEIQKIAARGTYDDVAILYRLNAQSRILEEVFLNFGIPYTLVGGTRFYERKEIKDIIAYVRLIINPEDEVSLNRAVKMGKRRLTQFKTIYKDLKDKKDDMTTTEIIDEILQKTDYLSQYNPDDQEDFNRLENVKELRSVAINFPDVHQFLEQIALVESEYSENEKMKKGERGVTMMTLHQAKGLEFPYVFLVGVEDGILPHSRSFDDIYQLEEERRLFYVGITRARKALYLTYTKRRFIFGRRIYTHISRFISDNNDNEYDPTQTW